jgi:phosphohistidine phosphatase
MNIYIVRHAIAEDIPRSGPGDAMRALTAEGRKKMKEAAAGFAKLDPVIDRIFTSPLVRARQTAEIIAKEIDHSIEEMKELAPGHSPSNVCAQLEKLEDDSVMVVGHEPNCSELANYLLGDCRLEFKKGAICFIECDTPKAGTGILIWHLSPAALRSMK